MATSIKWRRMRKLGKARRVRSTCNPYKAAEKRGIQLIRRESIAAFVPDQLGADPDIDIQPREYQGGFRRSSRLASILGDTRAHRRQLRRGAARAVILHNGGEVVAAYSSRGVDYGDALHVAALSGLRVAQDRSEVIFYRVAS